MSKSTTSVEPDNTDKPDNTVEPASLSPSNINWTPIDMPPRISAVGSGESQNPTSNSASDDTALNQSDNTADVKPQSVPNKLSIGYMSLYPLLCVVMNLAFIVMMMLDIRAFQRYNALCVGVWVFTIISVVYALAIGWVAINDDIKTRHNSKTDKTDKTDKQNNNPVETNADDHTANNTATQNDTVIPVSDTVRVETVEKTIEEVVVDNTDNAYVDNNNQPSNDKYPKGASKYDEPLIVDADDLASDKTLDNKQVLHPANKTPFEPVEPTKETADNLSFPQKDISDTSNTPDPEIMKMPHVPAVPAVIIKKHDESMTQHVPNTASVHDDNNATGDTGDDNNKHDNDTKANQPQLASADTSDNTDDTTTDAHDDADADADVITRIESDPDIIAVEQRIINQTEPPQGTPLREVRKEIKDALAVKTENHAATASNDEQDDADTSDKQTPSVPDGSTYTFDVD